MVPGIDESSAQSGALHALLATTVVALVGRYEPLTRDVEHIIGSIGGYRHDGREGVARVFGPFDDPDGHEVEWIVSVEEVRRTTRWTLSTAGDDATEPSVVAEGSSTHGTHGRTVAWMLWLARHAVAIGDTSFDPDVDPDSVVQIEVVIGEGDGDGEARMLAIRSPVPSSSADPLEPVLADGVQWWSDDGGGRLTLRSAVPLSEDVLTDPLPALRWVEAAWDEHGKGEIAAVVSHADGDREVLVRECLDPAGRAVFRSIDPESAAAPGQMFGEDHACPAGAVLPQPP